MVHTTGAVPLDHQETDRFTAVLEEAADDPAVVEAAGHRIITEGTVSEDDGVAVVYDGYLTAHEDEELPGLYDEHGADVFRVVDGRFRMLVADPEQDRLLVATDRGGDLPTYRADGAVASGIDLLLEAGIVDPVLDRERALQYLLAPQAMRSGGRTLVSEVEKLRGSSFVVLGRSGQQRYWDWYRQDRVDLTDEEAVAHLDDALAEAAADLTDDLDELRVLFTGGLDSSLLLWYLQEHGSAELLPTMLRFPEEDPDVERARSVAADLGHEVDMVDRSMGLPGPEEVWETGEPINFGLHFDFGRIRDRFPDAVFAGGDKAIFAFPAGHTRLRKLQAAVPLRPVVRAVARPAVRRGVQWVAGRRMRKAIDILAGGPAEVLTNTKNLSSSEKRALVDRPDELELPEEEMEWVWGLDEDAGLVTNFYYLEYRQMEGSDVPLFLRGMRYRDVFTYPAVRDRALRIPMRQKRERRLMERLAADRVPDRVLEQGPSGRAPIRRALEDRIDGDREQYRRRIDRLLERGLLRDRARDLLHEPEGFPELAYAASAYMLEAWIEGLEGWN